MQTIKHNPTGLFPQYRCYTHAVEIRGDSRLLIISGLNGYLKDGPTDSTPDDGSTIVRFRGDCSNNTGDIRHQRIYFVEMPVAPDAVADDEAIVDEVLGFALGFQQVLDRLLASAEASDVLFRGLVARAHERKLA